MSASTKLHLKVNSKQFFLCQVVAKVPIWLQLWPDLQLKIRPNLALANPVEKYAWTV